jgi:hypothetical protein
MVYRALAFAFVFALLGACAPDKNIYGEPDNAVLQCNALPEPGERAACRQRLGGKAPGAGPPACHPASTAPKDRHVERC